MEPEPLSGKLMLVGIGAQKSGTSWLYRQLARDPRVFMPIKEMHFFDAVYRPDLFGHWPQTLFNRVKSRVDALTFEDGVQGLDECSLLLDHAKVVGSHTRYLDMFRSRIGDHHKIFGDITPSYATLDIDGFRAIRSIHDNIRILFSLRDPVDRLISSVRHERRLSNKEATAEDVVGGLDDAAQIARCRYDLTLERLDEVFEPGDVFVTFIEDILTDAFAGAFGAFVGLDGLKMDVGDTMNVSPPVDLLSPDQVADLRSRLDPVYVYCRNRFGNRIPASWMT